MPRKFLDLPLLSLACLRVGFRSTLFLIVPRVVRSTAEAQPIAEPAIPIMAAWGTFRLSGDEANQPVLHRPSMQHICNTTFSNCLVLLN